MEMSRRRLEIEIRVQEEEENTLAKKSPSLIDCEAIVREQLGAACPNHPNVILVPGEKCAHCDYTDPRTWNEKTGKWEKFEE